MRFAVRRKLELANAVRQFSRDHPSDDPSYAIMLGALDGLVTSAEALAAQEIGGRIAELAAAGRRDELRRSIHFQLLRHLIKSGELAAKERPELIGKFRIRSLRAPHTSYLISARKMLEEGIANRDLLASVGLSTPMLDELGRTIAQFETSANEVRTGKLGHVGARAQLEAVAAEILDRVAQLNAFNQHRFKDDPEKLASWESVRSLPAPGRSNGRPPVVAGVTPPSGEVAPAP